MSKKCCGIIYSQDEKFCTMCGKKLEDIEERVECEEAEAAQKEVVEPDEDVESVSQLSEAEAQKKLDAMDLPIMNLEEIEKLTADIMGVSKEETEKPSADTGEIEKKTDTKNKEAEDVADEDAGGADGSIEAEVNTEKADKVEDIEKTKDSHDDEEDDEDDENEASVGLKIFGWLSLLVMFAAIAAVVLAFIFVMFKPFYKDYDAGKKVVYPEIASDSDVTNQETRPTMSQVVLDEVTTEEVVQTEASPTDATPSDADTTDESEDEDTSEE